MTDTLEIGKKIRDLSTGDRVTAKAHGWKHSITGKVIDAWNQRDDGREVFIRTIESDGTAYEVHVNWADIQVTENWRDPHTGIAEKPITDTQPYVESIEVH